MNTNIKLSIVSSATRGGTVVFEQVETRRDTYQPCLVSSTDVTEKVGLNIERSTCSEPSTHATCEPIIGRTSAVDFERI